MCTGHRPSHLLLLGAPLADDLVALDTRNYGTQNPAVDIEHRSFAVGDLRRRPVSETLRGFMLNSYKPAHF